MPIYEYACHQCHDHFELLIRGSEQPACPQCGGAEVVKQLSVPSAHVGGSDSLPICNSPMPTPGPGCGLPQCGTGRCAMED